MGTIKHLQVAVQARAAVVCAEVQQLKPDAVPRRSGDGPRAERPVQSFPSDDGAPGDDPGGIFQWQVGAVGARCRWSTTETTIFIYPRIA